MIQWLIDRAKRTPYFHLDGYMMRWWLVPYSTVITRERSLLARSAKEPLVSITTDGTGPVTWRRPIAKLLQKLGIAVRIHEILRSDVGREPHDHPWPYLTVILRGGYWEYRYDDFGKLMHMQWHGAGSILYRPAHSWHLLHLREGETTTTLFITGRKCQTWGFRTKYGKTPYWKHTAGEK